MTEAAQRGTTPRSKWSFTNFLAALAGADSNSLTKDPSTKPGFVSLGLVILAAAVVAGVSMGFALTGPLRAHPAIAIPLSLGWGVIIIIIDRVLVQSMQGARPRRTILVMAVPRIIIAAVIGIVVSTPITLRIFESEIRAQVAQDQLEQRAELGHRAELAKIIEEIAALEKVKNGQGEPPASPALSAAQEALKTARSERDTLQKQADEVYLKRACEEAGAGQLPQCQGLSSGEVGQGPRWRALDAEYKRLSRQLETANDKVAQAQRDVEIARADAVRAAQLTMDQQAKDAHKPLCGTEDMTKCDGGLMKRKAELEEQIITEKVSAEGRVEQNAGLIAQLNALDQISRVNPTALLAHTAITLLFFMIEVLPVILKTMVALENDPKANGAAA